MDTPRCGVGDKNLNIKRQKRYTLMSSKWKNENLTYRLVQNVYSHHGPRVFIQCSLSKDSTIKTISLLLMMKKTSGE